MEIDVTTLFQCGTDDNKNIAFTFMGRNIDFSIRQSTILDHEVSSNALPNYSYLGDGFYLVRTQAGFVKAMTHFLGEKNKELEVRTYPKSYPSVITFHIDYNGNLYIRTTSIHVNKLLAGIN